MVALSYGFEKRLKNTSFDAAVIAVTEALKKEGFGILTQIDVKETLKKKLDVDFRRYLILGACNPPLAHKALTAEPQIGLLLPCNVVVQESPDGAVIVSAQAPKAMFEIVKNPQLGEVADDADARLRRVLAAL